MDQFRSRLPSHEVILQTEGPFAPSVHEPASMALIAARTLNGLPGSLQQVTGARRAGILGHLQSP